jgi:hypothetical protein
MMKTRIFFLIQLLAWAIIGAYGANVETDAARAAAARFLTSHGRLTASAPSSTLRLVHSEPSSVNTRSNDYYIFNTGDNSSYVIVAGDDRAETILAHGEGAVDMNDLPDGMQFFLELYKGQLEYLHAHPEMVVNKAQQFAATSVSPLLKTKWDQHDPYNCMCPVYQGQRCLTGCAATSMAMIFHYWQYPTNVTKSIPGYTTETRNIEVETLQPTTFIWTNMLNSYTEGYNSIQAEAVGKLMRYIGQAEYMDYTPQASGAGHLDILNATLFFGYDQDVDLHMKLNDETGKVYYNDEEWAAMLQYELKSGRPILYTGQSASGGAHAFNIDGYNAASDSYHVNFGWSGRNNGYYMLNAFDGGGSVYNLFQCYLSNFQPPVTTPAIKILTDRIYINGTVNKEITNYFEVKGSTLTHDVTVTLNDQDGSFTINKTRLSLQEVKEGINVPVIFHPTRTGTHTATVTLKSEGAESVTFTLVGRAKLEKHDPVMLPPTRLSATSFKAQWQDSTPFVNVKSYRLEMIHWFAGKMLLEQSFEHLTSGSGINDISANLDEFTSTPGWTGNRLYPDNGYLNIGSEVLTGRLTTPQIDLSNSYGHLTVHITAKCPETMFMSNLKVTCGDYDTTIVATPAGIENVFVLPCSNSGKETISFNKTVRGQAVMLSKVSIMTGANSTQFNPDDVTCYEGISRKSFEITEAKQGNYAMRVQAVYIDGTTSQWSEYQQFQLDTLIGDVNLDNEINIADINTAISMILANDQSQVGDVNSDGEVNIADVNAILDIILGNK